MCLRSKNDSSLFCFYCWLVNDRVQTRLYWNRNIRPLLDLHEETICFNVSIDNQVFVRWNLHEIVIIALVSLSMSVCKSLCVWMLISPKQMARSCCGFRKILRGCACMCVYVVMSLAYYLLLWKHKSATCLVVFILLTTVNVSKPKKKDNDKSNRIDVLLVIIAHISKPSYCILIVFLARHISKQCFWINSRYPKNITNHRSFHACMLMANNESYQHIDIIVLKHFIIISRLLRFLVFN